MSGNWSYVIASYALTFVALAVYVVYVNGRSRAAADALRHERGEETR